MRINNMAKKPVINKIRYFKNNHVLQVKFIDGKGRFKKAPKRKPKTISLQEWNRYRGFKRAKKQIEQNIINEAKQTHKIKTKKNTLISEEEYIPSAKKYRPSENKQQISKPLTTSTNELELRSYIKFEVKLWDISIRYNIFFYGSYAVDGIKDIKKLSKLTKPDKVKKSILQALYGIKAEAFILEDFGLRYLVYNKFTKSVIKDIEFNGYNGMVRVLNRI